MKIGALEIQPIYDGDGTEPARESLTKPGEQDPWACREHLLRADGGLELTLGGFLLRTGDRTVVIDAGVGTIDNGKFRGGQFLQSLAEHGVQPEDVTDVLFTHLHFDHVGWATKKGEVVFPRATYRVHAADWAHFVDSADADAGAVRKLSPLANQLEPFEADQTLAPGLDTRHVPGHTPGSTIFVVSSDGERALLIGDVAHHEIELTDPTWEAVFDVDKAAAKAVRANLIEELSDSGDYVAAAHFPGLRFGRVITLSGERRFEFV